MEQKDMTELKLSYISPKVEVVYFSSQDVIAASGFDEEDNWMDDDFTIE